MSDPVEVLDFWISEIGPKGWFSGGEAVDMACRDRFLDLWQAAHDGGLGHWVEGPAGTLAYLVLTDQFPRNMFRGQARAFATDARARAAARRAVALGWDIAVPEPERTFFYLPFGHSEDLSDQEWSVELHAARMVEDAEYLLHARAHREIIARFGRFPFRNAALGRATTPEEQDFLAAGAYPALVDRLRAGQQAGQEESHAPDA
ncbi:MAG: DUF924 domain-containing protein [Rhodobacteraceae bacterium]|nr:DUF924 domain-containing protein [Paracoccaceae bacterium]